MYRRRRRRRWKQESNWNKFARLSSSPYKFVSSSSSQSQYIMANDYYNLNNSFVAIALNECTRSNKRSFSLSVLLKRSGQTV